MRLDPSKVTDLANSSDNPVYIFNRSKPVSVLLNVKYYEELVEKLEDALDALDMKDLEKKGTFRKSGDWTSQNDLQKKLYTTR